MREVGDFVSIIAKVHEESMRREDRYDFDLPTHFGSFTERQSLVKLLGDFLQAAHGANAVIR